MMGFFEKHKAASKKYKETTAYKRHLYSAKLKMKLTFIFFGLGIILYSLIRKFTGTDSYTFMFALAIACIIGINVCADFLTRKNFKE